MQNSDAIRRTADTVLNTALNAALNTPLNTASRSLLWFRPLSPLNYTLPDTVARLPWAATVHIPIDVLQGCRVCTTDSAAMQAAPTWLLSSPTAAHLAVAFGTPATIAVMGAPTQQAWREAGGAEPAAWLVSPTGESMGLLAVLRQHSTVCVLRGQQGRNDLIEHLRAAGVFVSTVAVYAKSPHPLFVQALNATLAQPPHALCFTSADQPARVLAACADATRCLASPVFASHPRIIQAAQALGFIDIRAFPVLDTP
jgi:Uroporphyrinogen-III synthase HemD